MQNITYTTQLNNFGICCIVLDQYNKEYIQLLKNDGFRYFSKNHQWSKTGFNNLDVFNSYLIALFNNDTQSIKKMQPNKKDIIKQCITLKKAGYQNKKNYIDKRNQAKINELEKVFDSGSANLLLIHCINKKINFWDLSIDEAKKIIINDLELQKDIIDYNNQNNITKNTSWINNLYNEGLPF